MGPDFREKWVRSFANSHMGIALAQAPTVGEARKKAAAAAHAVEEGFYVPTQLSKVDRTT